ncbi:MAG: hypothetical protein ACRDGF_01645 [Chloroflexota bacterium]
MDPDEEQAGEKAAMWTYVGVLVAFKIVTAIFILYYTHAFAVIAILLLLHLPWVVGAIALFGAPGTYWLRLVRVRARRKELIRQEFLQSPTEKRLRPHFP